MTAPLPAAIQRLLDHVELPLESARLCDIEWAWEDYIAPALNALPDFIDSLSSPLEPEPAVPQPRRVPAPDSARVYGGGMRL